MVELVAWRSQYWVSDLFSHLSCVFDLICSTYCFVVCYILAFFYCKALSIFDLKGTVEIDLFIQQMNSEMW